MTQRRDLEKAMKGSNRRLYSGRGDRGETSVLSGETVAKDHLRVNAYGAVDELQSHLGMARSLISGQEVTAILYAIQQDLFVAGAELASTPRGFDRLRKRLSRNDFVKLETWIDQLSSAYGLPRTFVIPGRDPASAALHVARSVCRRCERLIVTLNREAEVYRNLLIYFNRLSDLLFALAWALELRQVVETVVRDLLTSESQGGAA